MKRRVFDLLYHNDKVIKFIYWLIILNVFSLILESYKEFRDAVGHWFFVFEFISVIIFTLEYLARIWVADLSPNYSGPPGKKRLNFMTSSLGIIDLIAILPFYLPLIFPFDLRVVRILRLFRLLRIFKLGRFSNALKTINQVLKETKSELSITLYIAFILLVFSSTLMYYIEGEAQPDKFASIGHAFWWSIATLTTVGYGDVYPVTALGKLLSAVIALVGIGFIALPTGIISSSFVEKIQQEKREQEAKQKHTCPNCGKEF